jgi:hypothetical protein
LSLGQLHATFLDSRSEIKEVAKVYTHEERMMTDQTPLLTRPSLMQEMGLTEQEIARRKAFLLFRDEDVEHLRGLHESAGK